MSGIDNAASDIRARITDRIKGGVAIVGIGNIMRGDDGLGPKLIELLKSKNTPAKLFDCGTAPENYIIPILNSLCDTVILVDAADTRSAAGSIDVFDVDKITNVSFSTHNPSPRLFSDLLRTGREDLNIFVISIQPKDTSLGSSLSVEVMGALIALSDIISSMLNG